MWDEVIQCLLVQERLAAATELLRERIAAAEQSGERAVASTLPKFYCLLGDLTKDVALYDKAWEVSGRRFSLAKRRLGAMAMFDQRVRALSNLAF